MLPRHLFLTLIAVLPCTAQFRWMEITLKGVGCASCLESLPARIQRMRGVESASIDGEKGLLTVRLAEQNRIRLEQIRDMAEQDGTKAVRAEVRVVGELTRTGGTLMLHPTGVNADYIVDGIQSGDGLVTVTGSAADLRPAAGVIAIRAREVRKE